MQIIGVDLGGTNMRAGRIADGAVAATAARRVRPGGGEEEILEELCQTITEVCSAEVAGIGIGVPGLVDTERGIVYDVVNIPSWRQVHLAEILQQRFNLPVFVNNDANCFAVGELYFGKARGCRAAVGLIIGTGLGAGIITNGGLYSGANCGAGEFGMLPYKDTILEHYSCGQFFQRQHGRSGEEVAAAAACGESESLALFAEFGAHLAEAVKMVLYALDPEVIVLGGSVSRSYAFFAEALREGLTAFAYTHSLERLRLEVSDLAHAALFGAAALFLDAQRGEAGAAVH
ncbi:MAG TPA: ROK family protein [bacterium]|nr:ROK family protein [bacterium]HPR87936.1 ROK family protein [bacterium]